MSNVEGMYSICFIKRMSEVKLPFEILRFLVPCSAVRCTVTRCLIRGFRESISGSGHGKHRAVTAIQVRMEKESSKVDSG